jgi:hypothetical protein
MSIAELSQAIESVKSLMPKEAVVKIEFPSGH